MNTHGWVIQLRKGVVEYIVLLVLNHGEAYAYEILQRLSRLKSLDFGESTLYPLLSRLTDDNLLTVRTADSPNGPRRRYYRLTAAGRKRLEEIEQHWDELNQSIQQIKEGKYRE